MIVVSDEPPRVEDSSIWTNPKGVAAEPTSLRAFEEILEIGREMQLCEACGGSSTTLDAVGIQAIREDATGDTRAWMEVAESCTDCGNNIRYHVPPRLWAAMELARVYDQMEMATDIIVMRLQGKD